MNLVKCPEPKLRAVFGGFDGEDYEKYYEKYYEILRQKREVWKERKYVDAFYSGMHQPPYQKFIFSLIFFEYQIWIAKKQQRLFWRQCC